MSVVDPRPHAEALESAGCGYAHAESDLAIHHHTYGAEPTLTLVRDQRDEHIRREHEASIKLRRAALEYVLAEVRERRRVARSGSGEPCPRDAIEAIEALISELA